MTHQGKSNVKKAGIVYFILALIFFVPLFLAWYLFSHKDTLGEKTTNHGALIQPPFPIGELKIYAEQGQLLDNRVVAPSEKKVATTNGKWMFLLITPSHCNTVCQRGLYNMRQVRLATGAKRNRIERAILTFKHEKNDQALDQLLKTKYSGTKHLYTNQIDFLKVFGKHVKRAYAVENGTIYIVDPLGNVLMSYHPNANPSNIFKDMERLLKVSQIG